MSLRRTQGFADCFLGGPRGRCSQEDPWRIVHTEDNRGKIIFGVLGDPALDGGERIPQPLVSGSARFGAKTCREPSGTTENTSQNAIARGRRAAGQFTFCAARTKAASSALKRGASSKNGEWPMP